MPQPSPVIIDKLDEFTMKLLTQIVDDKPQGVAHFVSAISDAREDYINYKNSSLLELMHLKNNPRKKNPRIDAIDLALASIKAYPGAMTRLMAFKVLVGRGKWLDSSFNYLFFVRLVNGVPGYIALSDRQMRVVIDRLKELIFIKADTLIKDYEVNTRLRQNREQELQRTVIVKQERTEDIIVANDISFFLAANQPRSSALQFCLRKEGAEWSLALIDYEGVARVLKPANPLVQFLEHQRISNVNFTNNSQIDQIKKMCLDSLQTLLDKTELLINPTNGKSELALTNQELIALNRSSTFILQGEPHAFSLFWINKFNVIKNISLDDYPKLKQWIDTQDSASEGTLRQLKVYLAEVKTISTLNIMDIKKQLGSHHSHAAKEEQVAPKKLTLANYASLNTLFCGGNKSARATNFDNDVPPHSVIASC